MFECFFERNIEVCVLELIFIVDQPEVKNIYMDCEMLQGKFDR